MRFRVTRHNNKWLFRRATTTSAAFSLMTVLIYKAHKYKYDFQQYESIRSFGESIYTGKLI